MAEALAKVIARLTAVEATDLARWHAECERAIKALKTIDHEDAETLSDLLSDSDKMDVFLVRQIQYDLAHPTGNCWPPKKPP